MSQMVFCRACGHSIHVSAPTCPKCGAPQATPQTVALGGKSKVVAGLLAILIGGLGVHRFYLGQWWGVFYLLLVWTGIPGLISLIEGIVFLCRDQTAWDARYNGGRPSPTGGAGAVVAIVVAVFVVIAMVGILAAIAIPAYNDYTVRAQSAAAHQHLLSASQPVARFIQTEGRIPATLAEAGFTQAPPAGSSSVDLDPNTAQLSATLRNRAAAGETAGLRLIPSRAVGGDIEWQCEAFGLREQQVPKACR